MTFQPIAFILSFFISILFLTGLIIVNKYKNKKESLWSYLAIFCFWLILSYFTVSLRLHAQEHVPPGYEITVGGILPRHHSENLESENLIEIRKLFAQETVNTIAGYIPASSLDKDFNP